MSEDRNVVLGKLRAELAFIEGGGYRNQAQWRPQFIFEDSPTCINRDPTKPRRPCRECALAEFVPEGFGKKHRPCRYIPLNERAETVNSLYRTGTQEELETAVVKWLKGTIQRLEQENAQLRSSEKRPEIHVKARFVPAE